MGPSWIRYQCPDCAGELATVGQTLHCPHCKRGFERREGILYLLPGRIEHEAVKLGEREAWRARGMKSLKECEAQYLGLPFSEEQLPHFTHYREAAREFRLAARYLEPLAGKRGLDLGGSIGWAAWRFAQMGAEMVLADFNDDAVAGLGGARVFLDQGPAFERLCVDAERLPLADGQFDFVYCCAFLHHLPTPERVVRHVARVLRPGGILLVSRESFCPYWMTRRRALTRCSMTVDFLAQGINEQVFYPHEYRRWFRQAGLSMQVVNPRWDALEAGRILFNCRLRDAGYEPEILANRSARPGVAGTLARLMLRSGAWRPLTKEAIFASLRPLLLAGTQKFRILIGTKPG